MSTISSLLSHDVVKAKYWILLHLIKILGLRNAEFIHLQIIFQFICFSPLQYKRTLVTWLPLVVQFWERINFAIELCFVDVLKLGIFIIEISLWLSLWKVAAIAGFVLKNSKIRNDFWSIRKPRNVSFILNSSLILIKFLQKAQFAFLIALF